MYDNILKRLEDIAGLLEMRKFEIGNKYIIDNHEAEVVDREDISIVKFNFDLKTIVVPQYCNVSIPSGDTTEVIYYNGHFIRASDTI